MNKTNSNNTVAGVSITGLVAFVLHMIAATFNLQANDDRRIRDIIARSNNYRYSNIQLVEVQGDYAARLSEFFKEEQIKAKIEGANKELQPKFEAVARELFGDRDAILSRMVDDPEIGKLRSEGKLDNAQIEALVDQAIASTQSTGAEDNSPNAFYLLMTRGSGDGQRTYIALLPARKEGRTITAALKNVQQDKVQTPETIYRLYSRGEEGDAEKMYQKLFASKDSKPALSSEPETYSFSKFFDNLVGQSSYKDVTIELQSIGDITFKRERTGQSRPLEDFRDESKTRASQSDIQTYLRVTDGQPFDYMRPNEVIVGMDQVSWKHYPVDPELYEGNGFTGLECKDAVADYKIANEDRKGQVIESVEPSSPAYKADLSSGMIVLSINNQPVDKDKKKGVTFKTVAEKARPGDTIVIEAVKPGSDQVDYYTVVVDLEPMQYNTTLPSSGVELRYGAEEINYPSVWSERATLSYTYGDDKLGAVKIGAVLPTGLWSSTLAESFSQRQFTQSSSGGISTDLNFSTALFKNSGVFRMQFTYLFGDAMPAPFAGHAKNAEDFNPLTEGSSTLLRVSGRLLYSFGLSVDKDFLFRINMGPAFYVAESWSNRIDTNASGEQSLKMFQANSETIADFNARVEFMTVNTTTPFGLVVSYFDRTLAGNLWFQFPIMNNDNLLALRCEGKWFWSALRDPRKWENASVVIPTISLVWNF